MKKFYLYVNSLMYFVFSIWCTLAPHWTAEAVGFSLPGDQGFAEYLAVYGGLQFSLAILFLLAAVKDEFRKIGLIFGACFYVSLFVFRSIAVAQVGIDIGAGVNFYIAEGVFAIWSVWLLKR